MLRVAGLGQRERRELSWASWRTERCWMRRKALAKKLSVSPKLWASKQSTWRVSESVGSRRETREVQVKVGRKPRLASPSSPLACRSTWSTCVPLDNHLNPLQSLSQMDPSLPAELRQAIRDCRDRGLVIASKWSVASTLVGVVTSHPYLTLTLLSSPGQLSF